jgi:hypothetical protein
MSELKKNIKTEFAKSFLEEFKKENNYLFISDIDTESNDVPIQPKDILFEENNAKKSILCAYQLYDNDVNLGIRRINWESGTVYQEFSDKEELSNFYVLNIVNNRYRVYKCLNNNNSSTSTVPPTGTNTEEEYKTEDKYVWKFMFEIPDILYKFITDDYIPVPVLDELLFNDERYLQSAVQSTSKSGTIEEINFSYSQENPQNFQVYDIISENYENPDAIVTGVNANEQTQEITLSISLSSVQNPLFLNPNDGYYNDNYTMTFSTEQEGIIVSTVKSYTINETNENIATIELCDISGNVSNIDVGTPYSITPKIIVRGDGDDNIIAIPIFENKTLVDIEMISAGTNYIKAEAYFLINSPYVLNPIISPNNGHGSEAYSELYSNAVIISKTLDKHTQTVSSGNKHYFGNGNNIHQFGIINNIKSKDNKILQKNLPLNKLSLIKSNSTVTITINNYTNSDNFFNVDDIITKGTSFKKDQFRAKINSITTNTNTILTCELINGLFDNYSTLVLKNETTNQSYTLTNGQFSVSYQNLPSFTSYDEVDVVLGKESLFTCNVLNIIEQDTTSIKYLVENLQKTPQQSYYNSQGDLVSGEGVGLLANNTDGLSVFDDSFLNVLSVETDFSSLNTCYSYILKITVNSKNLELGNGEYIQTGNYLDKYIITKDLLNFGKIVFVEYFNENANTGVYDNARLYIKPEKGTFSDFSLDSNRELYIVDTSPYEKSYILSEFKGFCSSFGSEYESISSNLDINSGKIIYLNNINTVTLNDTQSIEAKIVLEF